MLAIVSLPWNLPFMNTHLEFVRQIMDHPRDENLRLVYADWLEERGDPRSAFLRLEARLHATPEQAPHYQTLRRQVRALHATLAPQNREWLAALDRTDVENCELRFSFRCPRRWEHLRPTGDPRVRYGDGCLQQVYYCSSVAEARQHACEDHCVAIDSRLEKQYWQAEMVAEQLMTRGEVMGRLGGRPTKTEGFRVF